MVLWRRRPSRPSPQTSISSVNGPLELSLERVEPVSDRFAGAVEQRPKPKVAGSTVRLAAKPHGQRDRRGP